MYDESIKKKETKVLLEVRRSRASQTVVLKITYE